MPNLDRFSQPMSWEWQAITEDDLPFDDDKFQRIWMEIEDYFDDHGELPDIWDVVDQFDDIFYDDVAPVYEEARDTLCKKHSQSLKNSVTT